MIDPLRPADFSSYVGQEKLKVNLQVFIKAAKQQSRILDHILLSGPAGTGKTSLAKVIAITLKMPMLSMVGTSLVKPEQLKQLISLPRGSVVFIDEIHTMAPKVEEALLVALEDFKVDLSDPQSGDIVQISVPRFTCIGATTELGQLKKPLTERFGIVGTLDYLTSSQMNTLVSRSTQILDIIATTQGINEIVKRSRGTPRVANHLLQRIRDFSVVEKAIVDSKFVIKVSRSLGIDGFGLTKEDRDLLKALSTKFAGGPTGVASLAAVLNEVVETVESREVYLVNKGFLLRTSKGRVLTTKATEYLVRLQNAVLH